MHLCVTSKLPGIVSREVGSVDILTIKTPGGGGVGKIEKIELL
ncbi:hypothetical protein [Dyadobacter sp. NIV53]|nr:hypothetical protein [Dyadobacter sp. NIV53]